MNSSISTATPSLKLFPEQAASKHLMIPPGATIKGCALKAVFNACSKPAKAKGGTLQHAKDLHATEHGPPAATMKRLVLGTSRLEIGAGGCVSANSAASSTTSQARPELAAYVVPTPFHLITISAASRTSMPPSCISLGDHIDDAVLLCGFRLESEFSSASLVLSRRQPSRIHGTALQDHRKRHREGGHARKPLSALCTRQQAQVHLASYIKALMGMPGGDPLVPACPSLRKANGCLRRGNAVVAGQAHLARRLFARLRPSFRFFRWPRA